MTNGGVKKLCLITFKTKTCGLVNRAFGDTAGHVLAVFVPS